MDGAWRHNWPRHRTPSPSTMHRRSPSSRAPADFRVSTAAAIGLFVTFNGHGRWLLLLVLFACRHTSICGSRLLLQMQAVGTKAAITGFPAPSATALMRYPQVAESLPRQHRCPSCHCKLGCRRRQGARQRSSKPQHGPCRPQPIAKMVSRKAVRLRFGNMTERLSGDETGAVALVGVAIFQFDIDPESVLGREPTIVQPVFSLSSRLRRCDRDGDAYSECGSSDQP